MGVGLYNDRNIVKQKINGFNLEVNPLGLVAPIILFYALDKNFETTNLMAEPSTTLFVVNGINISSGGFTSNTQMNGLNISAITSISRMNGLSISAFATAVHIQNGVLVSGIFNYSSQTNGLSVSLINKSSIVNGIQVGMFNNCDNQLRGLQIGFVNISDKTKGLQLGLLNINKKRMMPFINF